MSATLSLWRGLQVRTRVTGGFLPPHRLLSCLLEEHHRLSRPVIKFFHGPMGSGKTTFAIQTYLNCRRAGLAGHYMVLSPRSSGPQPSRLLLPPDADQVTLGSSIEVIAHLK